MTCMWCATISTVTLNNSTGNVSHLFFLWKFGSKVALKQNENFYICYSKVLLKLLLRGLKFWPCLTLTQRNLSWALPLKSFSGIIISESKFYYSCLWFSMVRVKGTLLKLKLDRIAVVHLGNIAKANKVAKSGTLTLRSKFYNYFTNSKSYSSSSNKRLNAKKYVLQEQNLWPRNSFIKS